MRVERAPTPAFRELARLAHARLLTCVDDDTRFFLLARRIAKTNDAKSAKTETETYGNDPDASPAMRALYVARTRRETHRALEVTRGGSRFPKSPFARAEVVDLVLDATRGAIRTLSEAASRLDTNRDSTFADPESDELPESDEDADALVAGLNFFRFVLGRARGGFLRADDMRSDVAGVWSRRALVETHVAAPAAAWARSTLARLDDGEGASSLAKAKKKPRRERRTPRRYARGAGAWAPSTS